jgi:V8-like Glu-specific endopeptidase
LAALAAVVAALILAPAAQAVTIPFERTLTDTNAAPGVRAGKLFLHWPDGAQTDCSASVVDAPNHSTLITAAHCVYTNRHLGRVQYVTFSPGYHDGSSPYGEYISREIAVPPLWIAGRSHFDYAFIVVGRSSRGRAVQDVVGANPIAFNQPREQNYRLIGYPTDPPFSGHTSWTCNTAWGGESNAPPPNEGDPPTILAGCDMGEGASGGPWLTDQGAVASVTHTTVPSSPNVLGGPTLDDSAAALFGSVNTISTATTTRCKKKGHRSAVAAKKKKCKRKHRHR